MSKDFNTSIPNASIIYIKQIRKIIAYSYENEILNKNEYKQYVLENDLVLSSNRITNTGLYEANLMGEFMNHYFVPVGKNAFYEVDIELLAFTNTELKILNKFVNHPKHLLIKNLKIFQNTHSKNLELQKIMNSLLYKLEVFGDIDIYIILRDIYIIFNYYYENRMEVNNRGFREVKTVKRRKLLFTDRLSFSN